MTKTNTTTEEKPAQNSVEKKVEETPFEAVASICSVLVVGLFILTFLGQNFVIPSGSMEKTLLVGDHLRGRSHHPGSAHEMDAAGPLPRAKA